MAQNASWGPVDYRSVMDYPEIDELIHAISPERFIQAVGVEGAVEALGAERVIQVLGVQRVLQVALSQLTLEQQRQLRRQLPSE